MSVSAGHAGVPNLLGLGLAIIFTFFVVHTTVAATREIPTKSLVTIEAGRKINLICIGTGRPTVLFENGLGSSILDWEAVQRPVAKFTRACTYDRAGSGYSDPSVMPMTADNIADDVHQLISHGRLGKVILVGHSMGGLYATVTTDRFPADVVGLVLVDPSFAHQNAAATHKADQQFWQSQLSLIQHCEDLARHQLITDRDSHGCAVINLDESPANRRYQLHAAQSPSAYAALLSEVSSLQDIGGHGDIDSLQEDADRRSFGSLPLIVLTAGGHPDHAGRTDAQQLAFDDAWKQGHDALAARSTKGRSLVVSGAAHFIQKDRPQAVVDAIHTVFSEASQNPTP